MLLQLAHQQALDGHSVTICTTNRDFPFGVLPVKRNAAVTHRGVTTWYFSASRFPLRFSARMAIWLYKNIKQFDVVHIHGIYRLPTTFAGWWARYFNVPYVICPHGSLSPVVYQRSQYSRILKRLYERISDLPNLRHASAIHYTTQDELRKASFLGLNTRTLIVPNGLSVETYTDIPEPGHFRNRIGIAENIPMVLFLGRIHRIKGLDILIPAFASFVLPLFPNAQLVIAGPDNDGFGKQVRQWCQDHSIENHIIFLDHLDSRSVQEAYVDATVFVLPSYSENFGMTVVEAMACQCAVVISDQVSIWDTVQQAGAGLVVPLDPEDLGQAVCEVLSKSPDERSQMGLAGQQLVAARYSWPKVSVQMTRAYESLLRPQKVS